MRIEINVSPAGEAAGAVSGQKLDPEPDFLAAYFTEGHDAHEVAKALGRLKPRALHGGTSCRGVMSAAGMSADGPALGTFAVYDRAGDYGTSLVAKGSDARASARRAIAEALSHAGRRGEMPDLVWLTSSPGDEEAIIHGIQDEVGPHVPIIGGSAADDTLAGRWRVISAAGALTDGIVVSVLFPSRPLASVFHSGYAPTGERARATATDGRRVLALDGRPAADVYAEWTSNPALAARGGVPCSILGEAALTPFGRSIGHVADVPYYLLAHPTAVHPDGSIELFATVAPGEELVMMRGSLDSLAGRARRVARQSLELARQREAPAGALVVYSGGCMMAVSHRMDEVAAGVSAALGGAPFLGIFTFGEQGRVSDGSNRHGNLMISCVSFGV
ncbi:FIST signal transduction protein [Acuticoccus sediminis]|nr:FIST N-terminal domain-containing protein [Acuticoccus sediminis]